MYLAKPLFKITIIKEEIQKILIFCRLFRCMLLIERSFSYRYTFVERFVEQGSKDEMQLPQIKTQPLARTATAKQFREEKKKL